MEFDIPKQTSSIIKVIGVGGGGSNAVNHMFRQGIQGVDFIVCNTDQQDLDKSPVPIKVQLGLTLTEGRGAGSKPEVGRNAAIEDIDKIKELLGNQTKMVFVTAGMGGGTGTGAAPIIAKTAKEMGILTVGIVTIPFKFEGRRRLKYAEEGIKEMRQSVDTLLIINNERIREIHNNLTISNAFAEADNVLTTAAKGIAELITVTGYMNVDFEDVRTVMQDSGVALMGSASAEGENRALKAVQNALNSPLLNDNNIAGANYILLNITYGTNEITMDEISEITDYIQDEAGNTADVIWGHGLDESLGDKINVTIIATGFQPHAELDIPGHSTNEPERITLTEEKQPSHATENTSRQPRNSPENSSGKEEPEFEIKEKKMLSIQKEEVEPAPSENNSPDSPVEKIDLFADEPAKETANPVQANIFDVTDNNINTDSDTENEEQAKKEYKPWEEIQVKKEEEKQTSGETNPTSNAKTFEERLKTLRDITGKLRSPSGITELEKEPAFKRRLGNIDEPPHSSEENVSRYSLDDEEEKKGGLSDNNSFFYDNVD
ncbi:MAG: cell division protein FtsZ [Bacteroidetes bacterium]|nr:MAG: cell division protein FtsZ [Bacteroidota bacterium]